MLKKNINVPKTARYFLLGTPSKKIKTVWFVCHGYGQLASSFLGKFNCIGNKETLIVAPEGFHRFYKKGFSGQVGASWMTKEDRLDDIRDTIRLLDAVYRDVMKVTVKARVVVLGFSQGTASTCRWLCRGNAKAGKLILWGGDVPPDINTAKFRGKLNKMNLTLVIGDKDEFIGHNQQEELLKALLMNKVKFEFISYDGGHGIEEGVLKEVGSGSWQWQ